MLTHRNVGLSDLPALIKRAVAYQKSGWSTTTEKQLSQRNMERKEEAEQQLRKLLAQISGRQTINQLAQLTNVHRSTVNSQLHILMEEGKVSRSSCAPYLYWRK